ncbi:MAG: resolvase [Proteobacteria bacterium]|nr:resolvase [Pseudomonadota bacterium]
METGLREAATGGVAPRFRSTGQRIEDLGEAVRVLAGLQPRPRLERLSGLHNPWGHAAALTDAWRFLDLCEDPGIVDRVQSLIGPDIVLWDSELHLEAASYLRFVREGREGRYWPVMPLSGAVVLVVPGHEQAVTCLELKSVPSGLPPLDPREPLYVIRYMPATSHFLREARALANWVAMEEQPLINHAARPLWLVRGEDRAGNDFVTGFSPPVPRWAGIQSKEH